MSGFEIAGVVLGSLPLIISAMEHYAQGIATAKRFWKYKSEMRSLILQINTERGIFINTLEQLLTGLIRVEHMTEFLANPGGEPWQDQGIETKLKDRLRGAYQIYVDNVQGMEVSLMKMMELLKLGVDGKPQFDDPSAFKQEYRRLKFAISRSEYTELLSNLRSYNQALARLTKQSLELEPTRTETKGRTPNFKILQEYARNLYSTLLSGWRCGCQGHAVNLRLENRSEYVEKFEAVDEKAPFRVVFSYSPDIGALTQSSWNEAIIRFIEEKPKRIPLAPCSTPNITPAPGGKRQVRFAQVGLQLQQTTIVASNVTVTTTSSPTLTKATIPDEIQDLCKAITKLQQPQREACIGYLRDGLQRKHGIYCLEHSMSNQQQWTTYSLGDALRRAPNVTRRLTQHDKLRIAVHLASSVLQLHQTPWLSEQLQKDDVYFLLRPGASTAKLYEHPYVCRKVVPPSIAHGNTTQPALAGACRVIRNQTLFTLGILLIELWYGKSIEELQTTADLNCQGTPGVTWCTAQRLVENEIEFEAGKRYSDAVRRCILCDFDRKDVSLDEEGFQQAVYEGVVALLEKTLHQFSTLD
ncbi:hypothetical protein P154DRAFT_518305 [Amniculicola lignicola CBS 123094]|uniref:DUF7580 domain-containing protein n=1 Tax=Amniculicola lignicola CBS 123094 TaxID=1392246 RepID=A0A6A5WZD2_9PLEO|nr:hypothetical protein P154DRAFT_518305 [Amniculicola lignicola CBS 123094]